MRILGPQRGTEDIKPPLYYNYLGLEKKHSAEAVKGGEPDGGEPVPQASGLKLKADTYDVFFDKDVFEGAKEKLERYLEELPNEKSGWGTTEGPAGMQLADGVYGVISTTGGAVHPYRLVTGILSQDVLHTPAIHAYTLSFHP